MNAAKFTLTSTIWAAVLGLALGLVSAPAAAHECSRHDDETHKHCGGSGGGTTFYVQLFDDTTGDVGAFEFCPLGVLSSCSPIQVTSNTKWNQLLSEVRLELNRPEDAGEPPQLIWDAVFGACPELLGDMTVGMAIVEAANWKVSSWLGGSTGGVGVQFIRMPLTGVEGRAVEVTVQLIGRIDHIFSFLPEAGLTKTYVLDEYRILGRTEKRTHPKLSCDGNGFLDTDGVMFVEITAPPAN